MNKTYNSTKNTRLNNRQTTERFKHQLSSPTDPNKSISKKQNANSLNIPPKKDPANAFANTKILPFNTTNVFLPSFKQPKQGMRKLVTSEIGEEQTMEMTMKDCSTKHKTIVSNDLV